MKNPTRMVSYFLVLALIASTCAVFFVMWKYNALYDSIQTSLLQVSPRPAKAVSPNPAIEKYAGNEWKTWESSQYVKSIGKELSLSITYPRDFEATAPFLQFPEKEWSKAAIGQIAFPQDAFANEGKNDFREGRLEIFSSGKTDSAACAKDEWKSALSTSTATLGGLLFDVAQNREGAAGSFYTTETYYAKIGDTCLKFNLIAGNVNRENYENPLEYKQIDPARPLSILRTILDTAEFTPASLQ